MWNFICTASSDTCDLTFLNVYLNVYLMSMYKVTMYNNTLTKQVDPIQSYNTSLHIIISWVYGEKHSEIRERSARPSDVLFVPHPRSAPKKEIKKKICIARYVIFYKHGIKIIYSICLVYRPVFRPLTQNFLTVHANKDCVSSVR